MQKRKTLLLECESVAGYSACICQCMAWTFNVRSVAILLLPAPNDCSVGEVKPTPVIASHNVMCTRDYTSTVIPTSSDEAMVPKSVRGGDIQPGETAGIIIGILALALLLLAFTVSMYVYYRHVQKKKGTYNYTSGSVPVTEFHTNDLAVSYPAYDNCTYSELSDSACRPDYMTADQKAMCDHTEEDSDRERFRSRQVRD